MKTWKPIVQSQEHHVTGDQLEENAKIVNATLDKIRKSCQDSGTITLPFFNITINIHALFYEFYTISEDAKDSKPDYLLKNISEAKEKIKEVEKLFSEESIAQRALESRNQVCILDL